MKSKQLLQEVKLRGVESKVRPILVENDHPLFDSYDDLTPFFQGNIRLAIPRVSSQKTWSDADQIEFYSPIDGNVEKINFIEYENKVKPLVDKLLNSLKNLSFDKSDPDQFEKKALIDAFEIPSEDLSEYIVKVGSYYVLCNWGLENAPKLGKLPPPPTRPDKQDIELEPDTGTEDDLGAIDIDDSDEFDSEIDNESDEDNFPEPEEIDIESESTTPDKDEKENEALIWLKEYWWRILLGILLFILLLFLVKACPLKPSGTDLGTAEPGTGSSEQSRPQNGSSGESGFGNELLPSIPSTPSDQAPSIISERPNDLVEREQEFGEDMPSGQWIELGTIFQMETEEGDWYWLRLKSGETYLINFIPKEVQTNSIRSEGNNFNSI